MPSLWKRLRTAVSGGVPDRYMDTLELWREIYGSPPSWTGKSVTLQTALQVSAALACGRVISEGLAMLPWKTYREAGKEINPARDHPLYDKLMVAPNPVQTAFEFVETMGLHLAFCFNAYVWKMTVSRRIDELWLIEPAWVTVKYDYRDQPRFEVRSPDGKVNVTLTSDDVWHIRGPSWGSYQGMDYLLLARQTLGLTMALEEGQARLQSNGARMGGILSVEGTMTDDQQKKLRAWIEKDLEGSGNAGRIAIVDRGSKFLQSVMTNVDAQLAEQRRFQIEEVCRGMRVLPIMIGAAEKAQTYASSEQMFLAHLQYTLGPWCRRLEQSADKNLLTPDDRAGGLYTKFNEKAVLRMTSKDQAEVLARYVLSGVMVRNEARKVLELNPIDGLDEPLAPANTFVGNPPSGEDTKEPRQPAE